MRIEEAGVEARLKGILKSNAEIPSGVLTGAYVRPTAKYTSTEGRMELDDYLAH